MLADYFNRKINIVFLLVIFFIGPSIGAQQRPHSFLPNTKAAIQKKITPTLAAHLQMYEGSKALHKYIVTIASYTTFLSRFKNRAPICKWIYEDKLTGSYIIQTTANFLATNILSDVAVVFADLYQAPHTEAGVIGYYRYHHGVNMVDHVLPFANGKGIVVGVKEQMMDSTDLDLQKRVKYSPTAAINTAPHATTIASLIGGAGNSFYNGRGIAHGCFFYPSSFANVFADDGLVLAQNNVSVQNHSYGTVIQQYYGSEAVSYDAQSWQYKNLVHVFSAGNRGIAAATEGPYAGIVNYANLTGNFKLAKNVITVGAIDGQGNIVPISSAGPAYDGRLVPQLTAVGANGTSDAAAMVSGTVAVMQQVYADSNGHQLPAASLIKAILYNTADEVHQPGIDYKTGYGLLNSYEAVKAIQQKKYLQGSITQSQVWQADIQVPPSSIFKATLAWTDTAAALNNVKALVNDLDLEIVNLSNQTVYKPWVLNATPHLDSLQKAPERKRDSLNTAEQVSISLPTAGSYRIVIKGTAINQGAIPFHVALQIDTLNKFEFTNPRHTSDINRQEESILPLRWKAAVADTNQSGTLAISYNNGMNWQLIASGVKLHRQVFYWPIKDTASVAQFRMETSFGTFLSATVVMSKVLAPQIDFLCSDSFRMSWPKHIYANAYAVYALSDSAYLKNIRTVTDTFAVFNKLIYPYDVYAVRPILADPLTAARSIAININLQSVNCFYKALNYTQLDSNSIQLMLELSTTTYIDSIFFERITANGVVLQMYNGSRVVAGQLQYENTVQDIPVGPQYFRAKIKLTNGAIIFSDMVSIISSGQNSLWIYPNPIATGGTLHYFLRNQQQYFQLQILNSTGQWLKSWEVAFSGSVTLPYLPAGIYFIRLIDSQGSIVGGTKLIIQ